MNYPVRTHLALLYVLINQASATANPVLALPPGDTKAVAISTAEAFCQRVGHPVEAFIATPVSQGDNSDDGPEYWQPGLVLEAADGTTVKISDAKGVVYDYTTESAYDPDLDAVKIGPLLTKAEAIDWSQQVVANAGYKGTLQLWDAQVVKNGTGTEMGDNYWSIDWRRTSHGVPYLKQGIAIELDAETGRLIGMGMNFHGGPQIQSAPVISRLRAIVLAKAWLRRKVKSSAQLRSARLFFVDKDDFRDNRRRDTRSSYGASSPTRLAWECVLVTDGYEIVDVAADTGEVIGYDTTGPADIRPRPHSTSSSTSKEPVISLTANSVAGDDDMFLQKHFNTLGPGERKIAIRHVALQGHFIDAPEFWSALDTTRLAVKAANYFQEPFSQTYLNALEKALAKANSTGLKTEWKPDTRAAAILYRYGRQSGFDFLDAHLKGDDNLDAAVIFAMNQNDAEMNPILDLLKHQPIVGDVAYPHSISRHGITALSKALAVWKNPNIKDVFWQLYQRNPYFTDAAPALANQGVFEALPLLRQRYFSPTEWTTAKVDAGMAIVSLDGAKADQIFTTLVEKLTSPTGPPTVEDVRPAIIQDFGIFQITKSAPALENVIDDALDQHRLTRDETDRQSSGADYGRVTDTELAVDAAEALARIGNPEGQAVVSKLLQYLAKAEPHFLYSTSFAREVGALNRVARADLDLGGEGVVKEMMGKDWLAQERAKRLLKPLPDYLLPPYDFSGHTD